MTLATQNLKHRFFFLGGGNAQVHGRTFVIDQRSSHPKEPRLGLPLERLCHRFEGQLADSRRSTRYVYGNT